LHSLDLFGEPEGAIREGAQPNSPQGTSGLPQADMQSYLRTAVAFVRDKGARSTIGYRHVGTMQSWSTGETIRQFHYYHGDGPLLHHDQTQAIIGEMASGTERFDPNHPRYNTSPPITLRERLEWVEDHGYDHAFLWSASRKPPNERHDWGRANRNVVRDFLHGATSAVP
jgi:hypothetical protein